MAKADDQHSDPRPTSFTWFVRGCGCLGVLVVVVLFVLPMLAPARSGRRFTCANNLKQIGLSLKMYSYEDPAELFPLLSREPGRLMFEPIQIYPEFMPDTAIELCPQDTDFNHLARKPRPDDERSVPRLKDDIEPTTLIADWSYFYLGYAVRSDEDVERFAAAYREHMGAGRAMEEDITAPDDPYGVRTIFRLREGVERKFVFQVGTDIYPAADSHSGAKLQSEIPILIERIGNHPPAKRRHGLLVLLGIGDDLPDHAGANVLYFDGHVEFIKYPGKWPMTEKTVRILNELDALGEPPADSAV